MIPRATYRLQFHAGFTFADAQAILPYLDALGISHVYASPITMARRGSTHGYDVIDPTRINPELGGEAGFRALVEALRARGMGIIIDIVPNHMGVAEGENLWWNDVLRLGRQSPHAIVFDIDWNGPIILPLLGATLPEVVAAGDLKLAVRDGALCFDLYAGQFLPLRPGSAAEMGWQPADFPADPAAADLLRLAGTQQYRLVHWRTANDLLNWRRFFAINELAAVRVEDPVVFAATHRLYFDLFRDGLIDGVRVDHVDGLTDPAGYCRALRAAFDAIRSGGERAYIVVEKILAADEPLATDWGVEGTSGYDAMRDLTGLLHDPAGWPRLEALWRAAAPETLDFEAEVLRARQQILAWQFEGQLAACVSAGMAALASADEPALEAITPQMMRRAMERLLWVFPVYRTYGSGADAPAQDEAVRDRVWRDAQPFLPPGEEAVARHVLDWLAGTGVGERDAVADVVRRFQQLSAPIAAKAVEDTAFYRHALLLSANDVGFAPEQPAIDIALFHRRMQQRQAHFPHAMIATATHDHKRGEDSRARLALLSELPDLWAAHHARWDVMAGADRLHAADRYQLLQGLFGAWPQEGGATDDLPDRIEQWIIKMLREAKLRSSWEAPDEAYEQACTAFARSLLHDPAFQADMNQLVGRLTPAFQANMLVQTALKYTIPGVPDLYQGTELADLSLVDPDNRRPVDFARRQMLLAGAQAEGEVAKLRLIARLLDTRRAHPQLFAQGDYAPVEVEGARARHVLAFTRSCDGERLLCVLLLHAAPHLVERGVAVPDADWWGDTRLVLPSVPPLAQLLRDAPVHVEIQKVAS